MFHGGHKAILPSPSPSIFTPGRPLSQGLPQPNSSSLVKNSPCGVIIVLLQALKYGKVFHVGYRWWSCVTIPTLPPPRIRRYCILRYVQQHGVVRIGPYSTCSRPCSMALQAVGSRPRHSEEAWCHFLSLPAEAALRLPAQGQLKPAGWKCVVQRKDQGHATQFGEADE